MALKKDVPMAMQIETYFGLFAKTLFTAMGASLAQSGGGQVTLDGVELHTTNILKLQSDGVESLVVVQTAQPMEFPFVLGLTPRDTTALTSLSQGKSTLQKLMEQAAATGLEPFNFITRQRNQMTGCRFKRNVTGQLSHHLNGELSYTMALARFGGEGIPPFAIRLLVTPRGRDLIEDRAMAAPAQRAFYSVLEGHYVCRPQGEPKTRIQKAGPAAPVEVADTGMRGQIFFTLNGGALASRMFQQPAVFTTLPQAADQLAQFFSAGGLEKGPPPDNGQAVVVRLWMNGQKELEAFVVFSLRVHQGLMTLSRSAAPTFVGDFFRVLFGEAAKVWGGVSGRPYTWHLAAVKTIPPGQLGAVAQRISGGGIAFRQQADMTDGRLEWRLVLPPATWNRLRGLAAGLGKTSGQTAGGQMAGGPEGDDGRLWAATGLNTPHPPWEKLVRLADDTQLRNLVRLLEQSGMKEPEMALVCRELEKSHPDLPRRWVAAMAVGMGERTQKYTLGPDESPLRRMALTGALLALLKSRRLPEGPMAAWVTLWGEFFFQRRQTWIARHLPLRHLTYGLDKNSLARLLHDQPTRRVAVMLCGADYR
ncbi:MAG: hypothetical protein OEW12_01660, partial [Deltaproteobacteria bacterium]|nr:hypothetical protein [Deltaproteobacteria bacterium]